jgi:hypothetical protein
MTPPIGASLRRHSITSGLMSRPIICMTPACNEDWVLERQLACASLWADHILVADQRSTDRSRDIIKSFPKAVLIDNPSPVYNIGEARLLLLAEARKIKGPRVLVALDADEILSATVLTSTAWKAAQSLPVGTVLTLDLPLIEADFATYTWFDDSFAMTIGLIDGDDGGEMAAPPMHEPRLPIAPGAPHVPIPDVTVMHLQTHYRARFLAKHRWYQCWEVLNGTMSPGKIFRLYHRLIIRDRDLPVHPVPHDWVAGYVAQGIALNPGYPAKERFWWERQTLALMEEHGAARFASIAIWDHDWVGYASELGLPEPERFADPRSRRWRWYHDWLARTQPDRKKRSVVAAHSLIRRVLRV